MAAFCVTGGVTVFGTLARTRPVPPHLPHGRIPATPRALRRMTVLTIILLTVLLTVL